MKLIVGLGNPGTRYKFTRHNIGFLSIDYLANFFNISIRKRHFGALWGVGSFEEVSIALAKPYTFMNKSGTSVLKLSSYFNVEGKDIIVIHDDIDIPFGKLRIKRSGGHGGHKGVRSIIEHLKYDDFIRIRAGIDRPEGRNITVEDYVLEQFTESEVPYISDLIMYVKDAAVSIISDGIDTAMNKLNNKG